MKKDFIISKIEASQDGTPYIYVTFNDANDYKAGGESSKILLVQTLWHLLPQKI